MTYLLIEPAVKAIAPNIALMKWARYCELNNIDYQYVRGCVKPNIVPDKILISCIFTTYTSIYEKTIDYYTNMFPGVEVLVGGVFPSLFPKWFEKDKWSGEKFYGGTVVKVHKYTHPDIEHLIPKFNVDIKSEDALYTRNRIVLYASRGCPNKCSYCAVPRLEGDMNSIKSIKDQLETGRKELSNAGGVVLYDNNFTEHKYFDNIVDELIEFGLPVDIHGLHLSAFNEHQAKRFSELKWGGQGDSGTGYLRFSFDHLKYSDIIEGALLLCKQYKIKANFFLYCLYNYNDSPEDFWFKVNKCQELVNKHRKLIMLFPQRYVPFDPDKSNYIGKKWSKELLIGFKRMYSSNKLNNFLPITKSGNIYRYIGNNIDEWKSKCMEWYKKEIKLPEGVLTI